MLDTREKLVELLGNQFCGDLGINGCDSCEYGLVVNCSAHAFADHLIANGVVIPVRCKDCKYYHTLEEGFKDCIYPYGIDLPGAEDFCSYGKRRANATD